MLNKTPLSCPGCGGATLSFMGSHHLVVKFDIPAPVWSLAQYINCFFLLAIFDANVHSSEEDNGTLNVFLSPAIHSSQLL